MFHLQSDQYRKCNVWTPIPKSEKSHTEMLLFHSHTYGNGIESHQIQPVAVNKVPLARRKKAKPWTPEEHKLFLEGLKRFGKGDWKNIARNVVRSRTPSQVANHHAQKYFLRNNGVSPKKRGSMHNIKLESLEQHNSEPPKMGKESDQWVPQHHPIPPPAMQHVDPLSWGSLPPLQTPELLPHHDDWVSQLPNLEAQELSHHLIDQENRVRPLEDVKLPPFPESIDLHELVSLPHLQPQGLPNLFNQSHHDLQMQQYYPHLVDQEKNYWVPPLEDPQMPQLSNQQVPPLDHMLKEILLRNSPNLEAQDLPHHQEKWVLDYMHQLLQEIHQPPEMQQLNPPYNS